MKSTLILIVSMIVLICFHSPVGRTQVKSKIYTEVEQEAEFPGGDTRLSQFIVENFRYPKQARQAKIQGTVIIGFVIDATGAVRDVTVKRGLSKDINDEAVRVISSLPRFIPAKVGGKPVASMFVYPLRLRLE